jgi:hypothetical protein
MPDRILLYISAAPNLTLEREVLGRATIEIPTTLGWRVRQTPGADERLDLQAVARADVHLLIMGGDIRAPVGAEWLAAQQAGRTPALFLKQDINRTPAGTIFVRDLERYAAWRPYDDASDLRRQALLLLTDHILERADYYDIRPDEFRKLRAWRKQVETAEKQSPDQTEGGAGASSVILSPERFVPFEGKLVRARPKGKPINGV